ncbi:DUF262 domain-containing protein [Flavobacterium sp. D33]|nr:DUF262 domain-containing protein [Flavobacterium selenitireducens]MBD3583499.1 DUF262 domain-containing protein [Flavobacterium selenitireducens]
MIEIPIIQRDYVQGDAKNIKIRQSIVSKFKDADIDNPTKLDFIYGNVKDSVFFPLDGQQRLTTLFLYHLYFAIRDKKLSHKEIKDVFRKFSYSTRISSKEFFKNLIDAEISLKAETELSKKLQNQNWFIKFWNNDPTVVSALGMLDEIHSQCFGAENGFNYLTNPGNKDITFEFLELQKFGLSDDLYIKMNARGKSLSAFENLKADLIGHIKVNEWETDHNYDELFSTRFDGIWTDYFWNDGKTGESFDLFVINFFQQFLITEIATRDELVKSMVASFKGKDQELSATKKITVNDLLYNILENKGNISERYFDSQSYQNLYRLLDHYALLSRSFICDLPLWNFNHTNIDSALISENLTYPARVLIYAHSCFITNMYANDNNSEYNKWIRVVRNIVSNSAIDSIETFRGALQLIKELSAGCHEIHLYLSTYNIKSKFSERQVSEEIKKSKLIVNGVLLYEDLKFVEDTRLCAGRAEFVLYYIENRANSNYSLMRSIGILFNKYFNDSDFIDEVRALFLTCQDHRYYEYWTTSWVYVLELPKRCLIESTGDLRGYSLNINFRTYFADVVEKLLAKDCIDEHLRDFTQSTSYETLPTWKKRIIADPKILQRSCKSKMIAVSSDDSKCYLMNIGKPRNREALKNISQS